MVVDDPMLFQDVHRLRGRRPGRCGPASRLLTSELGDNVDTFSQDIAFLFFGQVRHEFVRIAMHASRDWTIRKERGGERSNERTRVKLKSLCLHFMSCISNFGQLFGKGFESMRWSEEGSFDVVLCKKF